MFWYLVYKIYISHKNQSVEILLPASLSDWKPGRIISKTNLVVTLLLGFNKVYFITFVVA